MDGTQQLLDFCDTIEEDARIGITHVSLYVALLYEYLTGSLQQPIYANSTKLMKKAKMSRRTYMKCIRELQQFGYISYKPSCDPGKRSQVYLKRLQN